MLCTQRQPCAANVLAGCVVAWVGWQAPGEGEAMCVALEQARIVDGIITKDTDALLFGARLVITHTEIAAQKNVRPGVLCAGLCASPSHKLVVSTQPMFTVLTHQHVLEETNLGRRKLIAFAVLCGSDYFPKGVPRVGPKRALAALATTTEEAVLSEYATLWSLCVPLSCRGE